MADIARYFDKSKHDGGYLPGVPLDDVTQEQFDALPEWLQKSVDASPFYRKTRPSDAPKAAPKTEKES